MSDFERLWPAVERRLRATLAARRVPAHAVDDIVQETALRLLRRWESVKTDTLTAYALTTATNLLRDEARRAVRASELDLSPLEEPPADRRALARIQLRAVNDAMDMLNDVQRSVLLAEVDRAHNVIPLRESALKMARLRARKRLRELLDGGAAMSGAILMRLRRILGLEESLSGAALATTHLFSALAIVAAGMAVPHDVASASEARPDDRITLAAASHDASSRAAASNDVQRRVPAGRGSDGFNWIDFFTRDPQPEEEQEMNSNVGPVQTGNGRIWVGQWSDEVGPYGADEEASYGDSSTRLRVVYDPSRCVDHAVYGTPRRCRSLGKVEVHAEVEAGGTRQEISAKQRL